MTNARIRAATVLDASAVAGVQVQGRREAFGDSTSADDAERTARAAGEWEAELADPARSMTWVADRDGAVVGFAHAVATGPGGLRPLELRHLVVLAAERGHHTDTHLLEFAVGDAPCQLWVGADDRQAIDFYRSHGFELDGARRAEGSLAQIRMLR